MLTIGDYYNAINKFAPFDLAESWDNVGILIGNKNDVVTGVLLALDVTTKVIEEAVEKKANLIISHHPLIFNPIKAVSSDDLLYKLIQKGIGLISAHTNLDIAKDGLNDALANIVGLKDVMPFYVTKSDPYYKITVFVPTKSLEKLYESMTKAGAGKYENYSGSGFVGSGVGRFLPEENANPTIGNIGTLEKVNESRLEMIVAPDKLQQVVDAIIHTHPYEEPSYDIQENFAVREIESIGRIGVLSVPTTCKDFAIHLRDSLATPNVRYNDTGKSIHKVAVCGGSGGDFFSKAVEMGADAYVTGEIKHNYLLDAVEHNICVLNAGHFATENVFMEPLKTKLERALPTGSISASQSCTDGVLSV